MALNKIVDFKGLHKGKRLFILASGPSLKDLDLAPLSRRIVMGMNRSIFAYPNTQYHATFDRRIFEEYPDLLKQTRYLFTTKDRPFGIPIEFKGANGFSFDLENGIYTGYTISYFALQVAIYMGFKQIIYLGLDLKTQGYNTHFFGHDFHSIKHDTTEFPKMKKMFEYGLDQIKDTDIEVYNCSPVCEINAFRKITYEEAIAM